MIFNKKIHNWNLTETINANIYKPNNLKELKIILKKKKKFFLKTGNCGYGDKSISKKTKNQLSLENFNKIISFDNKKGIIETECGISLYDLSSYLYKKNYFLFNVPGGLQVSLGGAISGNVHGRFTSKQYSTFGDNVKSLKILDKNLNIKKILPSDQSFKKFIGGFGIFGIILSAELYIKEIKNFSYLREKKNINSIKEFKIFFKKNENFYGFINPFNIDSFNGIFYTSKRSNHKDEKSFIRYSHNKDRKIFLNIFAYLLNNFTMRIFIKSIFIINKIFKFKKNKKVNFENTLYHSRSIYNLPLFFNRGMLEFQISLKQNDFEKFYKKLSNLFDLHQNYPFFFIIKKMHITKKKYFNSFPKFNLCISLGFPKIKLNQKSKLFNEIFRYIKKNNFDYYKTKDEVFNHFEKKNFLNKKYKKFLNNKFTNLYMEKNDL